MSDKIKRMLKNEHTARAGSLFEGSRPLLCQRSGAEIILRRLRFQEIV